MSDRHDLMLLVQSRTPLIVIETNEELRALHLLTQIRDRLVMPLFKWSITEGLHRLEPGFSPQRHNAAPEEMLRHIKASNVAGIYVLIDFHPYLNEPTHVRLIKDILIDFNSTNRTLVMLSHAVDVPAEISNYAARFDLQLPDRKKVSSIVSNVAQQWAKENGKSRVKADPQAFDMLVSNLSGLSATEIKRLARQAIYDDGAILQSDIPGIMQAKYALLSNDDVLQFEYETEKFSAVGGFRKLKKWLSDRAAAFNKDIKGLDKPKGILLLGVQGCGKSLAAKAVAGLWGLPLLRMDFAAMFNKYHGESERNLRDALQTAEVMSPCVLWVDEIEKALSSGDNDGGTSKRILGTLLTWMAERSHAVFMVATANDIQSLPPELVRKGRFDEIFFVDLPDETTRKMIFEIHINKREQDLSMIDVTQLAQVSDGFSGAEIEQAVIAALYMGHARGEPLSQTLLQEAIAETQPLSVVMAEKINYLRQWASARTVPVD